MIARAETLLDLLEKRRNETEARFFFYDGFERRLSLNGEDLWIRCSKFASLIGQAPTRDSCVVIALNNGVDFVAAFFGSIMNGWSPVPLQSADFQKNAEYRARLETVHRFTGASVLVTASEHTQIYQDTGFTQILHPRNADGCAALSKSEFANISASDTCFIQFSSGSTSEPKGVMLSHTNLLANLDQIEDGMDSTLADVGCSWLPFYHDMGWIGGFLSPLYTGYPIHVLNPIDFLASPLDWLKLIMRVRASLMLGPDFAFRTCARKIPAEEIAKLDLSCVRLALSGGEPVSAKTCSDFLSAFAPANFPASAFFPVYGLAENSLAVSFPIPGSGLKKLSINFDSLTERTVETGGKETVEVVSCGRPLRGIDLKVVSDTHEELSENCVGHIFIKSPSMTSGYYRNAVSTRELFHEGWLKTGDLGFLRDGELYLVDRFKDTIVIHGKNLFPADLERKAAHVSGFKYGRCAIVSARNLVDDEEQIHAVVETRELLPWRRTALRKKIAEKLSEFHPVSFQNVHPVAPCTLPRTSSGKVKHFQTKQMVQENQITRAERSFALNLFLSNLNVVLQVVSFIWNRRQEKRPVDEVLDRYLSRSIAKLSGVSHRKVKPDTTFASLQMDSLTLLQLHARLNDDVAKVPLHELIEIRNVAELRTHLLAHHSQAVESWLARHEL